MKRIGLLGGSFDPVHLAHVALAQSALSALALEQVQLIPTANPWQREALQATPAQRLDMLALAIADQPGLAVNPIEIERAAPPTPSTPCAPCPAMPATSGCWAPTSWPTSAPGAPGTKSPSAWTWPWRSVPARRWRRPPNWRRAWELGRGLQSLPFAPMAVSASEIRRRLAKGESTAGMLAEPVAAYIAAHNLYR